MDVFVCVCMYVRTYVYIHIISIFMNTLIVNNGHSSPWFRKTAVTLSDILDSIIIELYCTKHTRSTLSFSFTFYHQVNTIDRNKY